MATEVQSPVVVPVEDMEPGYYVIGELLGMKPASSFERSGETIAVKPKLGVRTPAGDLAIAADSESAIGAALAQAGVSQGDTVAVRVRIRAPFGAQGPVKFVLMGSDDDAGWK